MPTIRSRLIQSQVFMAALIQSGCGVGGVAAPSGPQLRSLAIDTTGALSAGYFIVRGTLASGSELTTTSRVRLDVETSTGDRELAVGPPRSILLVMRAGHVIDEVLPRLESVGAQPGVSFFERRGTSLWLDAELSTSSLREAATTIAGWPNVESSEPVEDEFVTHDVPSGGSHSEVIVVARTSTGRVIAGDGRVQIAPRGRLTVRYRQPDGTELSANVDWPQ